MIGRIVKRMKETEDARLLQCELDRKENERLDVIYFDYCVEKVKVVLRRHLADTSVRFPINLVINTTYYDVTLDMSMSILRKALKEAFKQYNPAIHPAEDSIICFQNCRCEDCNTCGSLKQNCVYKGLNVEVKQWVDRAGYTY
jgi:hypothetical protein